MKSQAEATPGELFGSRGRLPESMMVVVVELARLAYNDRAGPDNHDLTDAGALGHGWADRVAGPPVGTSR